jgi:hypothetical protein
MRYESLKCFMLGIAVALLAVIVMQGMRENGTARAADGGSSGSANGIISVVGGNTGDVLYVLDTNNQVLICYEFNNSTGDLRLKAARNIQYDTKVSTQIESRSGFDWINWRKALELEKKRKR